MLSGCFTESKARWQIPPLPPRKWANSGIVPPGRGKRLAQKLLEHGSGRRRLLRCMQCQHCLTVAPFYVITSDDFGTMAFNIRRCTQCC